jgi:signal transduction histidine kinase
MTHMSEPMRILALLGPITVATVICAIAARSLVRRAGLAATMVAIAVVASLVTVVDLVVLNHFMLINPGNRTEIGLVALYSLTAGVAAAMIVGRSTSQAIRRLVVTARSLGHNDLNARVGDLHASPELQLLGRTLDQTAARLATMIEAERQVESERRDLMTSISHDLRTPLASLRAMVEAISDGVVDDPETMRRYAGDMLRSIMTLVEMVEDLFELSSLDSREFASDDRLIPLSAAVQQAVDRCTADAAAKAIRLDVELGARWSTTRFATRRRAAGWPCAAPPPRTASRWRLRTRARASPPTSCRGCSSRSGGPIPPAPAAAPAWG